MLVIWQSELVLPFCGKYGDPGCPGFRSFGNSPLVYFRCRQVKSNQRHQDVISIEGMEFEDSLNVSQNIEDKFISEALRNALDEIGEPDREIIIRHYYYYQSSTVISEKMQMNSETVKSRIKRAKDKLKKILTERGFSK